LLSISNNISSIACDIFINFSIGIILPLLFETGGFPPLETSTFPNISTLNTTFAPLEFESSSSILHLPVFMHFFR